MSKPDPHWDGIFIQKPEQRFTEKEIKWAITQVLPLDLESGGKPVKFQTVVEAVLDLLKQPKS